MCNFCNSLVYSRLTSKTQRLKLSASYLSKLTFGGSNLLNLLVGRDFYIV